MFGSYKTFFRNGNIKEEGIVFENKWDSPFSNYYEDGSLREKRNHKKGTIDVKHYFHYTNGKVKESKLYINGKFEGDCFNFYNTGQLWIKSQYKNGKLEGTREVYFEQGNLEKTELCRGGFKIGKPHH